MRTLQDENGKDITVLLNGRHHKLWTIHDVTNPQHEVEVTQCVVKFRHAERIVRGMDDQYHSDFQIWVKGQQFYGELDRGTESKDILKKRISKYAGCPVDVMWICPNGARADVVLSFVPEGMEIWVTTYPELLANVQGHIWRDRAGNVSAF
ncbi:MAG: hypothetical protein H7831_08365 [Magnetococcus sp. WYHC-3]